MSRTYAWKDPVRAEPDFEQLLKVLRREVPDRPTLFEFFLNGPLYARLAGAEDDAAASPAKARAAAMDPALTVRAFRNAGYDYATVFASNFAFPKEEREAAETVSLNEGGMISDRAGFEGYPWPDPERADFSRLEQAAAALPTGMKLVSQGPGGVLENVISLAGFETLCFLLADDPGLAGELFDAVGSRLVSYYRILLQHEAVGAIIGNDDWGFKTQPMLAPEHMRHYVLPWHRRIVEAAHAAGKPAILHSCGNLASLMDDVIDDLGYDGKHSFEDAIQPVEEAYEQYGRRIAILGGLDVDFVIRSSPEQVYRRAREMLERASGRGGYALGTGNSVPAYVPDGQYFAMIAAALEGR